MDLRKIPQDVQAILSASAKINNFKRAIEELVYNSLDAECTSLALRIHIQKHWIQVIDNGIGIKEADFKLLGERYATSKLIDVSSLKSVPSKYGYQGQALANIIEVSQMVKITSRCANSNETWAKIFFEGKERECRKVALRASKGTTVEINGFLFNLNIQKKYINAFNELQDIKVFLEQLKLVFNNVSISLRDDFINDIVLKIPKTKDIYQTLKSLFDLNLSDFQELQVEKNEYKVKAYIGIEERRCKNYHWIYLNNKFVNSSNFHKLINDKFLKPNHMQQRKINKTKKLKINDGERIESPNLPFYFLFITCPYYEYDTVNSGKKTSLEFKNWEQIHKIIEKVIQFYNGDIHLIKVQKNIDDKHKNIPNNSKNTRIEVEKIMKKILGNHKKSLKISQMQNGVKGKHIKRKKKKKLPEKSLKIMIPSKSISPFKVLDNRNKIKLSNTKIYRIPNTQTKPTRTILKDQNMNEVIYKQSSDKHCNNLIELFKNNIRTIDRKCGELSCEVKYFMNLYENKDFKQNVGKVKDLRNHSEDFIEEYDRKIMNINFEPNIWSEHRYKNPEINICHKSPKIQELKLRKDKNVKSYDLLHTVLTNEPNVTSNYLDTGNQDVCRSIHRSQAYRVMYSTNSHCASKLTFDSHKYNIKETMQRKSRPQNYMIEESSNNVMITNKNNLQVKAAEIATRYNTFKSTTKTKHYLLSYDRMLNNDKHDELKTSLNTDESESNIIEVAKKIRHQVLNDMSLFYNNEDVDRMESTEKVNAEANIKSTYKIVMDSFHNSSQVSNVYLQKNLNNNICVAASKEDFQSNTYKDHIRVKTSCTNSYTKFDMEFTSEQQSAYCMDEPMQPLELCEVVISNHNENEDEFNKTYGDVQKESFVVEELNEENDDYLLKSWNSNELLQNNISTNHSQVNTSKNKIIDEKKIQNRIDKNEELVSDPNCQYQDNIKNADSEISMLQDNSLFTFKLNSRQRFMPKGMSQIYQNCFSKYICSYNLGTEYYKDTVYNNFVKDIAINCENLESNVQNMKDFTAGNIQKMTKKLKKIYSDLKFGPHSLAAAVVLGQLDCKFIVAKLKSMPHTDILPELLVLFDQHAVHERIRLENNLSYYFNGKNWKSVTIDAISLKISKDDILYLHNHKYKFGQFGLEWTILNDSHILVTTIPEAIVGRNPRPAGTIINTVKCLILEQINTLKSLKGNVSLYPQSIMNLVCSEACRYAIKFGDKLSLRDCCELITTLAKCKTPFQCAHGRPVMAVMVELQNNRNKYLVNMQKVTEFKKKS